MLTISVEYKLNCIMICWSAESSWHFQTTGKVNSPAWTFECLLYIVFMERLWKYIYYISTLHAFDRPIITLNFTPLLSFTVIYSISKWACTAVSAVEQQSLSGQGCVILYWVCDVFNLKNLNQQCWSRVGVQPRFIPERQGERKHQEGQRG